VHTWPRVCELRRSVVVIPVAEDVQLRVRNRVPDLREEPNKYIETSPPPAGIDQAVLVPLGSWAAVEIEADSKQLHAYLLVRHTHRAHDLGMPLGTDDHGIREAMHQR
jgi:hypothetical protein